MKKYIEQIKRFTPTCLQEEKDKEFILELIEKEGDSILERKVKYAHITSSGLVLNRNFTKVLMAYHKIYDSWAWTGGHADGEKDLFHVALREVKEETGVKNLIPLTENIISLEVLSVHGHMKNGDYISRHLHLNVTYVFICDESEKTRAKEDENSGVMWIDLKELDKYCTEIDMIDVYRKIVNSANNYRERNTNEEN